MMYFPGRLRNGTIEVVAHSVSAVLNGDEDFLVCDATANVVSLTLPDARLYANKTYGMKKLDAGSNNVTFTTSNGQTIDGIGSLSVTTQYQTEYVVSNGANWLRLGVSTSGGGGGDPNDVAHGKTGLTSIGDNELLVGSAGAFITRSYINGTNMSIVDNGSSLVFNADIGQTVVPFSQLTTNDATPTDIHTFTLGTMADTLAAMEFHLRAQRTGGSSIGGSVGDTACFNRTFRIVSDGTTAKIGVVQSDYTDGDDNTWVGPTVSVAGNTVTIRVTGAPSQTIVWEGEAFYVLTQL